MTEHNTSDRSSDRPTEHLDECRQCGTVAELDAMGVCDGCPTILADGGREVGKAPALMTPAERVGRGTTKTDGSIQTNTKRELLRRPRSDGRDNKRATAGRFQQRVGSEELGRSEHQRHQLRESGHEILTDGGQFEPPEFVETDDENELRHNSAPDRFVLCSGGMDSTAMAHYLIEEVWGDDAWGAWNKRPTVVYLDTTIGLSSQRLYVQMLGREFGWQVVCRQTHQDFEQHTEEAGFYGNQQHSKVFNVVKGRQIAKMATESGNPHIYFGSRVEEKGDHVERKTWRDDIGAYTHNPIFDWSDADVVEYLRDRGVPFNPNWEGSHFTDCGCGATAAREELIELEAEGYEVFAQKLRDLEERVETGDRRETWAWGSFSPQDRRVLDAQNDDEQTHLGDLVCGPNCSGRAKALDAEYPVPDGGEDR